MHRTISGRESNNRKIVGMVDKYFENLKKLNAFKIDWKRNDEVDGVITTSKLLSKKLERLGINHYAEEYIGTYGDKLWTDDGRVLYEMLPFLIATWNWNNSKSLINVNLNEYCHHMNKIW